jgi:hypothetical protein
MSASGNTMLVMVALTIINLIVLGLNLSTPSHRPPVAGINESALVMDRDFERAVQRVVEKFCTPDAGTIHCKY